MAKIALNWAHNGERFVVESGHIVTVGDFILWENDKREVRIKRPWRRKRDWALFKGAIVSLCDGSDRVVIQSMADIEKAVNNAEHWESIDSFEKLSKTFIAEWKRQS